MSKGILLGQVMEQKYSKDESSQKKTKPELTPWQKFKKEYRCYKSSIMLNETPWLRCLLITSEAFWEKQIKDNYNKTNTVDVTVIVSNYNYSKYIDECLLSLKEEELHSPNVSFNVVVIDDASTDESREIIASWSVSWNKIKPLYCRENIGIANAINFAVSKCKHSKAVVRVDADDTIKPGFLKDLWFYFKSTNGPYPSPRLAVACNYDIWNQDLTEVIEKDVNSSIKNIACGVMYPQLVFELIGYEPGRRHKEEENLQTRNIAMIPYYLNKSLYNYRRHSSNKTLQPEYKTTKVN